MGTRAFRGGDDTSGRRNDECLTPPELIKALGKFDLDPCFGHPRPWETADLMYGPEIDGLSADWFGRVWCNPPYSEAAPWAKKCAQHNNGILLLYARTDTKMFHDFLFPHASGMLFIKGRLKFFTPQGTPVLTSSGKESVAGAPSVLISFDRFHDRAINLMPNLYSLVRANLKKKVPGFVWGMRYGAV